MQIVVHTDKVLKSFENKLSRLSEGVAAKAMSRALNHSANKGRTEVRRATAKSMGLPYGLMTRAIKSKGSTPGTLEYKLYASGGKISLKYFKAREWRGGVTARPWGKSVFEKDAFITSGRKGQRFKSSKLGGHVFKRHDLSSRRWGSKIQKLKGPSIPEELIKGQPLATFEKIPQSLSTRLNHELERLLA